MLLIPVMVFTLAVVIFVGLEKFINIKERGRTDPAQDAGSLRTIKILRNLAFAAAIGFSVFPLVFLPGGRAVQLELGAALVLAGFIIRAWAVVKLGESFTSVVMTRPEQTLISDGPYRYIRHPAYTGGLLFYWGLGTATGSLLGLVLIMIGMSYGLLRRINVEEEAMITCFGEAYKNYMTKTKRLIPLLY